MCNMYYMAIIRPQRGNWKYYNKSFCTIYFLNAKISSLWDNKKPHSIWSGSRVEEGSGDL